MKKRRSWRVVACLGASALAMLWLLRGVGTVTITDGDTPSGWNDDDPLRRAAACEAADAPRLVARASDSDWRVRASAFAGLDRLAPLGEPVPPRDMPMARREQVLLRWIDHHRPDLIADLCEVHAQPRHVELSSTMVQRCLKCHAPQAGTESAESRVSQSCAECHADLHAQYTASSHAQSRSHLRIATVNPSTRQVEPYNFGPLLGIDCGACHSPAGAVQESACSSGFMRPTPESCTACHADTARQWEAWASGPQPHRAAWPPGKIESRDERDARTCIDCHMPESEHRLTARRDPDLLRSGLDMQVRPGPGRDVTLVLTNLAGHDYPTGTSRRAVRVFAEFDESPPTPIAIPALKPGESRTIKIPVPAGATTVRCTAEYLRNRFEEGATTVEIARVVLPIPP